MQPSFGLLSLVESWPKLETYSIISTIARVCSQGMVLIRPLYCHLISLLSQIPPRDAQNTHKFVIAIMKLITIYEVRIPNVIRILLFVDSHNRYFAFIKITIHLPFVS